MAYAHGMAMAMGKMVDAVMAKMVDAVMEEAPGRGGRVGMERAGRGARRRDRSGLAV